MQLGLDTALIRNKAIVGAQIGPSEIALLCAETSRYYGLEGPGSRIWELLETPISVAGLCQAMMMEFDVAADVCQADTLDILSKMLAEGLIRETRADA